MRSWPSSAPTLAILLALGAPLAGCEQIQALVSPKPAHAETSDKPDKAEKPEKAKTGEEAEKTAKSGDEVSADSEFALPFAWETSTAEPLGQARGFLREVYAANGDYVRTTAKLFPAAGGDKPGPRATVITCADARVQAGAFDGSPENDDFTVRNLGNVVENSLGSVEYGVEQLDTPVLLVVGHTGCGAVKAAQGGKEAQEKLGESVSNELAKIHVSKKSAGETWGRAVVDNVRDQVAFSLQKFGRRVHAGKLTVVGAILDLTNEMGFGAGRLIIVDVNGNHDEKRIAAFNQAIVGGPAFGGQSIRPDGADQGEQAKPAAPEAEEGKAAAAPAKAPSGRAKRAAELADHGGRGGRQATRDDEAAKALVEALTTLPAAHGRLASE